MAPAETKTPAPGEPGRGLNWHFASTFVVKALRESLRRGEVFRRRLAGLAIGYDFVGQLLAFVQLVHARALDRADMNENILASVIRLNETKTFLAVEPLHNSLTHRVFFRHE